MNLTRHRHRMDARRYEPRVLVIEDNLTTSRTLAVFLQAAGYGVECAFDGRAGVSMFREGSFDLILLDLMLPDIDGFQVCRSIRTHSDTPVVMLTAKTTEDDIVLGLECGADDYVGKPFGSKELLARIRRCLRRAERPAGDGVLRVGGLELNSDRRSAQLDGQLLKLTRSEFAILQVLMRKPGQVFTRDQLIDQALGADFDGFDRTIDTHIWSLRKKMGEKKGQPRYILSELGIGYRMSDDHAP